MAEGDVTFYNTGLSGIWAGEIDLDGDTIKVALLTGHTPDIDADEFWSDVSSDEVSGTGYTAGGATLASKTVTEDDTNDVAVWDAANVTWTGLDAGTPSHAVFYKDTGTPSTSQLICYMEIATASNGGDYTIQFHVNGIARYG